MRSNVDFWEHIVLNPSPAYAELFAAEDSFMASIVKRGDEVLDIGCGEGRMIGTLLELTNRVTGVDIDREAVRVARERFGGRARVEFGDAMALPFPARSFDVVSLLMTLVNFQHNKVLALEDMRRVLRDDGTIAISVYAETALDQRLAMYRDIALPIKEARADGTVVFDQIAHAGMSEQFSIAKIEMLADEARLRLDRWEKVGDLAYICALKRQQ